MKIRMENLIALVTGFARGRAQAQEQERRDAWNAQRETVRGLTLLQRAAAQDDTRRGRLAGELAQLIRSRGFDPASPGGVALQRQFFDLVTAPRAQPDAGALARLLQPGQRQTNGGRNADAPVQEVTGPPPKPAPPPPGPFMRSRSQDRGFAELDVQTRGLLRQAEQSGDAALAKRLGALGLKLKARPAGFTPEQGLAELGAARESLAAKARTKELTAEVKANVGWMEKAAQARTVKPPYRAELEALRRDTPGTAPTDAASVAQVEAYLERVRAFRAKQPFGPTPAALGAKARRQEALSYQAHRQDDRNRDQVRRAKSPSELLGSLDAQREHARKRGLPEYGAQDPDLDDQLREITIRTAKPRPGDVAQRPGGPAATGRATPPVEVETKVREPLPLREARRYQAAARFAGSAELRTATLRRALDGYAGALQSPLFERMTAAQRRQVLAAADAVRTELGLPAFPGKMNERLTAQERQELGVRDARQEVELATAGLTAAQGRLAGLQRQWSEKRQLTRARIEKVQVLTRWLKQLAGIAQALRTKPTPDWWLLDTLNRGYENLNRDLAALAAGAGGVAPSQQPADGPSRKPERPTPGSRKPPILPPVGPSPG